MEINGFQNMYYTLFPRNINHTDIPDTLCSGRGLAIPNTTARQILHKWQFFMAEMVRWNDIFSCIICIKESFSISDLWELGEAKNPRPKNLLLQQKTA